MGFRITSLELSHFRNYGQFSLRDISGLEIFVGPNAIGKTNLLEAIHLLTSTTTFRHSQIAEMIKEDQPFARIAMEAADGNRELQTALALQPGKKSFTVNGKAKSPVNVKGTIPAVTFTPDDLELAKKSSSVKRSSLDELGSQLTKNYNVIRRDYEKIVRYKNRLLKEEASRDLVEAINETLVTCAAQLFCYRHALYRRLMPLVSQKYRSISTSDDMFTAQYVPSWDRAQADIPDEYETREYSREEAAESIRASLNECYGEEVARHRSIVGPHADAIRFFLSGKDASSFASQGQQRSIVLAFKLAEVEMIKTTTGLFPVLLLDDVMSELDETRRDLLVENVSDEVQTFITATDTSSFNVDLLEKARVVDLRKELAR